jgi:hypothetical protein
MLAASALVLVHTPVETQRIARFTCWTPPDSVFETLLACLGKESPLRLLRLDNEGRWNPVGLSKQSR